MSKNSDNMTNTLSYSRQTVIHKVCKAYEANSDEFQTLNDSNYLVRQRIYQAKYIFNVICGTHFSILANLRFFCHRNNSRIKFIILNRCFTVINFICELFQQQNKFKLASMHWCHQNRKVPDNTHRRSNFYLKKLVFLKKKKQFCFLYVICIYFYLQFETKDIITLTIIKEFHLICVIHSFIFCIHVKFFFPFYYQIIACK